MESIPFPPNPSDHETRLPHPRRHSEVPQEWWTMWDGIEDHPLETINKDGLTRSPEERIHLAATHFRTNRARYWPFKSLNFLWDQFRFHAGLLSVTPIWKRTDSGNGQDIDESDDEAAFTFRRKGLPTKPLYAHYGESPVEVSGDEEIRKLLAAERRRKLGRLHKFMKDPALSIQIFLSSSSRKGGLWYHDKNLINLPKLMQYWVQYLIDKNGIQPLPGKTVADINQSLQRAVEIIGQACIDLPLTETMSKAIPDAFNTNLKTCFFPVADSPCAFFPDDSYCLDEDTMISEFSCDSIVWPTRIISPTLFSILGPSSLPFRYKLHPVAEKSLRRISAIHTSIYFLGANMVKVKLVPWIDWDLTDEKQDAHPRLVDSLTQEALPGDIDTFASTSVEQTISIYILPETEKSLKTGMGIYGTWYQVAQSSATGDGEALDQFWFIDDVKMVLPGYYVPDNGMSW